MTIRDLKNLSEDQARELIESVIWPNGPICPHCGNCDAARMTRIKPNPTKRVRAGLVQCRECRRQTTVTRGTLMEGSHLPLRTWIYIIASLCNGLKGCSARQLWRELTEARMNGEGKVTYGNFVTIWYTCMRWREAFAAMNQANGPMGGDGKFVEADLLFVGGKPRKRVSIKEWHSEKQPIHGILERGGERVRVKVLASADKETLRAHLLENVRTDSHLMTDEAKAYISPGKEFDAHSTVQHGAREYARADHNGDYIYHNNGIESFWSLVRRNYHGQHHRYSVHHMHRYLNERSAVFESRKLSDVDRVKLAIKHTVGLRLYYKQPKAQVAPQQVLV